jgi:cytochrome P450
VRYHVDDEVTNNQKLASSSITNILPRMLRLQGPFGMYGTVYGVSTAVVHVAHPVAALAILQNNSSSSTSKAPAYNHFKNFCGEGVFTAEGDDWRRKRAAVLHALTRSGSGSLFFDRVQGEAEGAVETLMRELDRRIRHCQLRQQQPTSDLDEALCRIPNIVPLLQRATIGLIYRFLTHRDLATLESKEEESSTVSTLPDSDDDDSLEGKESCPATARASESGAKSMPSLLALYLTSITRIRMILLAQSRSIWFLLPRWCYTQFSSLYRAEEETMVPIRQVAAEAIARAAPMSPLRQLQQLPLYSESNGKCSKNLMDEAITLLFAGQDTSAATLSWTLHLLTIHPHVQAKLAEEVCREVSADETLSKKLLSRLPYLDAVLKESMRLYPVAPFVVRQVGKNLQIDGSEGDDPKKTSHVTLPEGSLACIWIYSLHRNPEYWERPDDFWPERWLTDDNSITPGSYMPFAAGARNCVGQPLANVILRTLLARLIHRYEFRDERVVAAAADKALVLRDKGDNGGTTTEIPGEGDPSMKFRKEMQAGFTVLPQDGLPLIVQLREHQKATKETSQ